MDDVRQQFEEALEHGKYDLALTLIENHDQSALRLLWRLHDMPEMLEVSDESLLRLLDRPTWVRFSKQLHQRVVIHVFTFTSVIFMGGLVLVWGVLETSDIVRSGRNYLPEITSFCLIPIGIMFLLVGGFFLFDLRRWLNHMKSESKKKRQ